MNLENKPNQPAGEQGKDDNDFLTTQFPGKQGSDISRHDEEKELVDWIQKTKYAPNHDCEYRKELSEVLEWVALFYSSLHELIQLKQNKEQEGENPDYLERKPKAWYLAKEAIRLWKESNYGALPLPTPSSPIDVEQEARKRYPHHKDDLSSLTHERYLAFKAGWEARQGEAVDWDKIKTICDEDYTSSQTIDYIKLHYNLTSKNK